MDSDQASEHKTYRRVICCKIKAENIEEFIEVFEEEEWKRVKIFGKRGAEFSYLLSLPNKTRYHLRLYAIDEYYYFLIHYEPTLRGDVSFHILGLFDRFRSNKENVLSSEKLELANYKEGIRYFKEEIVPKYAILKNICEYAIDEDELKYFAMKFGYISLKLPIEILMEELFDAILKEDIVEFYAILEKLFDTLEFNVFRAQPTEFLIIESPSLKNFKCLIKKVDLRKLDLPAIGEIIKQYNITETVIIPRKQDNFNSTLIQKLEHLNMSILRPTNLLKIFNIYKNIPIAPEKFQAVFKSGLIDANYIDETLQDIDFASLLKKSMLLFGYLKEQPTWTSQDTLEYEFVKIRNYTKEELQSILDFLTYPLINLILVKKEKRRFRSDKAFYRAIRNFDEIQFRLKNIKKFLSQIT